MRCPIGPASLRLRREPEGGSYDRSGAEVNARAVIFDRCIPFCVSRAFDEAKGVTHPRIWTAARDREMWKALQG